MPVLHTLDCHPKVTACPMVLTAQFVASIHPGKSAVNEGIETPGEEGADCSSDG